MSVKQIFGFITEQNSLFCGFILQGSQLSIFASDAGLSENTKEKKAT